MVSASAVTKRSSGMEAIANIAKTYMAKTADTIVVLETIESLLSFNDSITAIIRICAPAGAFYEREMNGHSIVSPDVNFMKDCA